MSSKSLSQKDVVLLYNESCILLSKWSSWEYQLRYSVSKVAYHSMMISQGIRIVSPSAHAIYDAQLLARYTYSGCYILYDGVMILDKDFWGKVESALRSGHANINHAAWGDLVKLRMSKFEPVCLCNIGINDARYIVLEKYNKLRDIINETMKSLDNLYFGLRRLGVNPDSEAPVETLLSNAPTHTKAQDFAEATAQGGTLGAGA
jgi:hypothetical protein